MVLRDLIVTGIYEYSNVGLTHKKSVILDDLRLNVKRRLLNEHKNFLFEELSLLIERELKVGAALKKKLDSINKPFADKLLKYLTSNEIPDRVSIDSIDYTKDDDKTLTGFFKDKDGKVKTQRFKVGKLLDYLGISVNEFKGYEIQELVSYLKKGTTKDFKIVDGKDILWAYHCDNYDEGETMGSCMRYDKAQKFLEIYTENPNEIKCLVLLNPNNNKVRGRALLFNMDNGQILMDRVYVINDEYSHLFNQYSDENNYTRRASSTVTLSNGGEYEYYPYMDTLMYYNPEDGILSETVIGDGYVKLQDTDGGSGLESNLIDIGSRKGQYVEGENAWWIDYVYGRMRYVGFAHVDDLIILDDDAYLREHVVELINGESAFIGDDEIYYIERGVNSGKYGRADDVVSLNDYYYDGEMATWKDVVKCDGDIYGDTGVFFMKEDTVETYNGKVVFKDDVVRLYPEHYGEGSVAHVDDTTEVKIKDFGHAYILSDDMDDFENKGLLEIKAVDLTESISVILRQALNESYKMTFQDKQELDKTIKSEYDKYKSAVEAKNLDIEHAKDVIKHYEGTPMEQLFKDSNIGYLSRLNISKPMRYNQFYEENYESIKQKYTERKSQNSPSDFEYKSKTERNLNKNNYTEYYDNLTDVEKQHIINFLKIVATRQASGTGESISRMKVRNSFFKTPESFQVMFSEKPSPYLWRGDIAHPCDDDYDNSDSDYLAMQSFTIYKQTAKEFGFHFNANNIKSYSGSFSLPLYVKYGGPSGFGDDEGEVMFFDVVYKCKN